MLFVCLASQKMWLSVLWLFLHGSKTHTYVKFFDFNIIATNSINIGVDTFFLFSKFLHTQCWLHGWLGITVYSNTIIRWFAYWCHISWWCFMDWLIIFTWIVYWWTFIRSDLILHWQQEINYLVCSAVFDFLVHCNFC